MILYHGSPETEIEHLEARVPDNESDAATERMQAVFLAECPWYASTYAGYGGSVYEVELVADAVTYRIPDDLEDEEFRGHLDEALDMNAEVVIYTGRTTGMFIEVVGIEYAVLDEGLLEIVGRWD